jgi:hypothetical protein
MSHTIKYSSSRAEVWSWYWKSWRRRLWRIHAVSAVIMGFIWSQNGTGTLNLQSWLLHSLLVFPVVVAIFSACTQAMFKSAERTLHVGPEGWSTQIGKIAGSRTWAQVAAVTIDEQSITILGSNGNALIVPKRAFPTEAARRQFFDDANNWRERYLSKGP